MLLFKPYHVAPIIDHNKTETRRIWKKRRAKPGSIHFCRLAFDHNYFAQVRILDVYEQTLGEMTAEAAKNEGGYTLCEYARLWQIINKTPLNPLEEVYVVEMQCTVVNLSSEDMEKYRSMYRAHMQALRQNAPTPHKLVGGLS
nr:ASCH domain-containing protein [uncultured Methanoregula sp.]